MKNIPEFLQQSSVWEEENPNKAKCRSLVTGKEIENPRITTWAMAMKDGKYQTKICEYCGEAFTSMSRSHIYCRNACRSSARRRRLMASDWFGVD